MCKLSHVCTSKTVPLYRGWGRRCISQRSPMLAQVSSFSVECAKLLVVIKGVVVGDGIFEPVLEEHHCVPVVHLIGDEVAQESGGRAGWEQLWKAVVNHAGLSGHFRTISVHRTPHETHGALCFLIGALQHFEVPMAVPMAAAVALR